MPAIEELQTRIAVLERLIQAMEVYSQYWHDPLRIDTDRRTLMRSARIFLANHAPATETELYSRLEETYIELLLHGYRLAQTSIYGSLYFERYTGRVVRVSDHRSKQYKDRTVRIDQEDWFEQVDRVM